MCQRSEITQETTPPQKAGAPFELPPGFSFTPIGLTLRQFYAAHALQGLLANGRPTAWDPPFTQMAFDLADKMIEREQSQ